jgi:hypothetical protein
MSKRPLLRRAPDLFGPPALLLFAAYVAIFYRRAFSSGVISDGWVMLEIGSRGLAKAPLALLSYHIIPIANLFVALLWKLFGLRELAYQVLNLAELAIVGWLVARLGNRLFAETRVGLLAGLLFLSNASFYDVPLWPVIGNFHSLAAMLYLAALSAVHHAVRAERPAKWLGAFALCSLLAFFTYEPTVSLVAVGPLYACFVPAGGGEPGGWRAGVSRARPLAPALAAVAAVVLASKLWAASQGSALFLAAGNGQSPAIRPYLFVRACIGLFTLRGADPALYSVFSFGTFEPIGGRPFLRLLALWLLGLTALAAWLILRSSEPAVRFLTAWLLAHLLTVSAGIEIVSRHFYLAALPASLLLARALGRGAERAAARISAPAGALLLPVVALLVAGARTDLDAAAAVHREATRAARRITELVRRRLDAGGAPPRVALVNMPAILIRDGMAAFTFGNGLHQQVRMATERRVPRAWPFHTYSTAPPGTFADKSLEIPLGRLAALVRDPGHLVLRFDPVSRDVLEVDRTVWRTPAEYSPESAPYLEWQGGAWPWLRVAAGRTLELPLAVSPERSWIALRYRRGPATDFALTAGRAEALRVRPSTAPEGWPTAAFPAPVTDGRFSLALHPASEVWLAGVWSFAPPAAYTPETAPFLPWSVLPYPAFTVLEPVRLPLAACPEGSSCTIRLEALTGPNGGLSVMLGDGPARDLDASTQEAPQETPEWRSLDLPAPPGRPAVVRLTPRGTAPVVVRRLAWDEAGSLQPSAR